MRRATSTLIGAAGAVAVRTALHRALLARTRRAMRRCNRGDIDPTMSLYADDAVVRLGEGGHRWAGEHRGRTRIRRFVRDFSDAVEGTTSEIWIAGPPWALRAVALIQEHGAVPDGRPPYRNQVASVVRTRWGKIVDHTDHFFSTSRLDDFEERLQAQAARPADHDTPFAAHPRERSTA